MGRKSLASERRAQILDAFYRCVTRDGLDNASIRQVAKEAGVQPSILHHYFKNRDEMVEEMVENIVDELSPATSAKSGQIRGRKLASTRLSSFSSAPT